MPDHIEGELTPEQSVEKLADYFSQISAEFPPLKVTNLPVHIQEFLNNNQNEDIPELQEYQVYEQISKAKKPKSSVPGDLPIKIIKEFSVELTPPITIIYNKISKSKSYPEQWKIEHQIPIPKVKIPESENELRNISKTQFLSKVYESFVGQWLLKYIEPFLDPGQCGLKGQSITHYLIKLLHFVHSYLDLKQPHAVLAALIDLSKAFNRVNHSLLIQDLYDMKTPSWLLNIMVSYLSERKMKMKYLGQESKMRMLPAGGPQGAYLGILIFVIKFNGAFLRPPIPSHITGPVTKSKAEKVKYIDDGTIAVSLNLKECLIPDPVVRQQPLNFRERTSHVLPSGNNILQFYLNDTELFAAQNEMKINRDKSNIMLFNPSRKYDFPPEMNFSDGKYLDVVSQTKLVGVVISNDLKWQHNTDYITKKAMQKIWILRRMKKMGMSASFMIDVFTKEIRSILEMAVPVWNSGLTQVQVSAIERVQKTALYVIFDKDYFSYEVACSLAGLDSLDIRRQKLCLNFARKNVKSRYSLFSKPSATINTRSPNLIVNEYNCNTSRFQNSSLPYLAKLLNNNNSNNQATP